MSYSKQHSRKNYRLGHLSSFRCLLLVAVLLVIGCGRISKKPEPTISYKQLLDQMGDLDRIADLSQPGSELFSSWDRTGGNDDFGHFLDDGPEGWKILAELDDCSGYISRFWCTGAKSGDKRIRIYIDNNRKPAIETTWDEWFGKAGYKGDLPLKGYEPYCWFSWLPVSFSRSLCVMQEGPVGDEKLYYQIAVNRLPEGQVAEPWSTSLMTDPDVRQQLQRLKSRWQAAQRTGMFKVCNPIEIEPAAEKILWEQDGADVIRSVQIKLLEDASLSVSDREGQLRALVVRMYWDGSQSPSVNLPLCALGGSMWHEIQYGSAYFGMSGGVYRMSFPMPYKEGARIAILNQGDSAVKVQMNVDLADSVPSHTLGYLHAGWRKTGPNQVGHPHDVVRYAAKGKYVGCQLGVRSLDKSWWALESDEQIFVDGESEASWKGTGLEDYFNGGWYYGNALASPFHGIVFKALARAQQYRLHPFDPVSFSSQLRVTFERGPGQVSHAEMESVSYCYLDQPKGADSDLRSLGDRRPVDDPLSMYTLMTEVLNMERLGDTAGAINTIRRYQERYPDNPFQDVLQSRIDHYLEPLPIPKGKGILGVYANAANRIYLDGVVMMVDENAKGDRVHFREVELPPGEHVLAVRFAYRPYPDFVQVMLEHPGGFVGTDNSWKYAFNPAGISWSRIDYDDSNWPAHGKVWVKGPPEVPIVWCQPNDRPWTQSRAWGIRPSAEWPQGKGYIVFRKRFVVE